MSFGRVTLHYIIEDRRVFSDDYEGSKVRKER